MRDRMCVDMEFFDAGTALSQGCKLEFGFFNVIETFLADEAFLERDPLFFSAENAGKGRVFLWVRMIFLVMVFLFFLHVKFTLLVVQPFRRTENLPFAAPFNVSGMDSVYQRSDTKASI